MLLLVFTNIFIHNQQPNLHSRNIFIHIYLCISYSRLYLLTFTRCLHSNSTSYSHYSFSIFCAPPLRIGQYKISTADYGLRTTDYGLGIKHGLSYKTQTKHYGLGIKYGLRYKTRTVRYGLGIKHEGSTS